MESQAETEPAEVDLTSDSPSDLHGTWSIPDISRLKPVEKEEPPPSARLDSPLDASKTTSPFDAWFLEASEEVTADELPQPASGELQYSTPPGDLDWDEPEVPSASGPSASGPAPAMPLPATCSGRLTLVFTPCPDAETLGFFWETLEKIAGASAVVDAEPVQEGAGFAFTLDLGNDVLVVEELKKLIPHTEMVAVGEDTLSIRWSGR